jgi:hypothetical protein
MEPEIFKVASKFSYEANKLEVRKSGCGLTISLSLKARGRWDDENTPPKIDLTAQFWDGSTHQTVRASSLGVLMDEVYRRLQFEDREALRVDEVQSRLVALPAPDPRHDLDGQGNETL